MEFDLCWKYLVLSFSLLHLHHAYLRLKECMHSSTCVMFCIKFFQENPYILLEGITIFNCKEIAPSNPNWLEFGHCKVFGVHKARKKVRDYCFDLENEKTPRTEELESGQQEMQEKIPRATKMMINLTKGKGITDDPRKPTSWKSNIDPFIVLSLNNHGEQEELKKNPLG